MIEVNSKWISKFNKRTVTVVTVKKRRWSRTPLRLRGEVMITFRTKPPMREAENRTISEEQFLEFYEPADESEHPNRCMRTPRFASNLAVGAIFPAYVKRGSLNMGLIDAMESAVIDDFNRPWIEAFEQLDAHDMEDFILTEEGQLLRIHWKEGARKAHCAPLGGGSVTIIDPDEAEARGIEAIKKYLHYHRNWRWAKFRCGHNEDRQPVIVEALLQGFIRNGAFRHNGFCRPYFTMEGLQRLIEWMPEEMNDRLVLELPSEENNMTLSFHWNDREFEEAEKYESVTLNGPDGIVEAWPWTQLCSLNELEGPEPRKLKHGQRWADGIRIGGHD